MSSFLDNFSKETTHSKRIDDNGKDIIDEPLQRRPSKIDVIPTKIVKDEQYIKRNKRKKLKMLSLLILCLILILSIVLAVTLKKVPNFIESDVSEVETWATSTSINLEFKKEYSLEVEKNKVISQSDSQDTWVFIGSKLEFVISQGPDLNEEVELVDFSKLNVDEAKQFISNNKLVNATVEEAYDNKIAVGKLVRVEKKDETFVRGSSLKVIYSLGVKPITKDISVKDFVGQNLEDVKEWIKKYNVTAVFEKAGSDQYEQGQIINQSIEEGEKISINDEIIFTISLGEGSEVPNFYGMSQEEASAIASEKGFIVSINERYTDEVRYGQLIYQSQLAGTVIYEENNKSIELIYSIGKPFIDSSMIGMGMKDVEKYFYELNFKKANLNYKYEYKKSEEIAKNLVIGLSVTNDYVDFGQTIIVYLSSGE